MLVPLPLLRPRPPPWPLCWKVIATMSDPPPPLSSGEFFRLVLLLFPFFGCVPGTAVTCMIPRASSSAAAPLLASEIIPLSVRVPALSLQVRLYQSKLPARRPPMKARIAVVSSTLSQAFLVANHLVRYSLDVSSFFWTHICRSLVV